MNLPAPTTKNLILPLKRALVFGLALAAQLNLHAQHGHLNAGAAGTHQNDPLIWANGADFTAASGYVYTLTLTNAGRYAGYYQGNITLTALPTTPAHAGPDPAASAPGSFIRFRMACLEGPPGGSFGFWDAGSTEPSDAVSPGQTSTNVWSLSQGDGSPGSDPYGHIHGRRLSATQPGLYKVSFTAVDTSTNGAGGGPIHTPSPPLPIWFQAGVTLKDIEPDQDHTHVRFGATAGFTWQVEACDLLGTNTVWAPVGAPVVGTDYFREVMDEHPVEGGRFYRVRQVMP